MPTVRRRPGLLIFIKDKSLNHSSRVIAACSVIVILLSISVFCLETVEKLRKPFEIDEYGNTAQDFTNWFFIAELFCIVWWVCSPHGCPICRFTCELCVRAISCPNKCDFISNALNVIDMISILPWPGVDWHYTGGGQ